MAVGVCLVVFGSKYFVDLRRSDLVPDNPLDAEEANVELSADEEHVAEPAVQPRASDPPDSPPDPATEKPRVSLWDKLVGDRTAPWAVVGIVLGATVALLAGYVGAVVQVSGNREAAREDFLRTQQQTAYSAFLRDEQQLVQQERAFIAQKIANPNEYQSQTYAIHQQSDKVFGDADNVLLVGSPQVEATVGKILAAQDSIEPQIDAAQSAPLSDETRINSDVSNAQDAGIEFLNAARTDLGSKV